MTDHKTISVYDTQVDNYMDLVKRQPVDNSLLSFIARFKTGDYILDLGCGPAIASASMRERGLKVDPTDASSKMVKLANEAFDIDARLAVFNDIKGSDIYDGVWASFSLLHATREEFPGILKALHEVLKPKGYFYLGMKIGVGSARDKFERYYSYYSEDELHTYLANAGFTVENVELGEAKGLAGNSEPWIALTSVA